MQTEQEQIDSLNEQAWEVRVSDSNQALALSEAARHRAEKAAYKKGEAQGLRTAGFCHIRLSRFEDAQGYLHKALRLFEELEDEPGQSDVFEYYGIIERSLGHYEASLNFLYQSLELRQKTNYREGESLSYYHLGVTYRYLGDLEKGLDYFLHSLALAREIKYWVAESYSLNNIGSIYLELGDYAHALNYYQESLHIRKRLGDQWGEAGCLDNIGQIHLQTGALEQAVVFCESSLDICKKVGDKKGEGNALFHLAQIYHQQGDETHAVLCAQESLHIREVVGDKKGQAEVNIVLADLPGTAYDDTGKRQEHYLSKALTLAEETKALDTRSKIHNRLYQLYKQQPQYKEALAHFERYQALVKEMHTVAVDQRIQNLEITHRIEQSKKEAEIYRLRNVELAGLYEESKKQQEALQRTLQELKATQAQLIQSEKMASLGELTAGIAHEIQNPLNFVNNFSEVNTELIDEMKTELQAGNDKEALHVADEIKENNVKINHHGKRADAIVKSMLEHSRSTQGEKQRTDLNALCDEYLRLSYHGFRAKNKSFEAKIETHFDRTIGEINVVPQDLGRVLLNLFNNAFYAVYEHLKKLGDGYEPTVSVRTKKAKGQIEIIVNDNGLGISKSVLDKIFQPFFTTKPTGQGTGLGLSLSYDIIKAHGGELLVESEENVGTRFRVVLNY